MHQVQFAAGQQAAGDIGLIRGDQQEVAGGLELLQWLTHVAENAKFLQPHGRQLVATGHAHLIQHPIPFEKNRCFHGCERSRFAA